MCEVCPEGIVMTKQLAARIREDGGSALIADYGEDGTKKNTLRVSFLSFFSLYVHLLKCSSFDCRVSRTINSMMCSQLLEPQISQLTLTLKL